MSSVQKYFFHQPISNESMYNLRKSIMKNSESKIKSKSLLKDIRNVNKRPKTAAVKRKLKTNESRDGPLAKLNSFNSLKKQLDSINHMINRLINVKKSTQDKKRKSAPRSQRNNKPETSIVNESNDLVVQNNAGQKISEIPKSDILDSKTEMPTKDKTNKLSSTTVIQIANHNKENLPNCEPMTYVQKKVLTEKILGLPIENLRNVIFIIQAKESSNMKFGEGEDIEIDLNQLGASTLSELLNYVKDYEEKNVGRKLEEKGSTKPKRVYKKNEKSDVMKQKRKYRKRNAMNLKPLRLSEESSSSSSPSCQNVESPRHSPIIIGYVKDCQKCIENKYGSDSCAEMSSCDSEDSKCDPETRCYKIKPCNSLTCDLKNCTATMEQILQENEKKISKQPKSKSSDTSDSSSSNSSSSSSSESESSSEDSG